LFLLPSSSSLFTVFLLCCCVRLVSFPNQYFFFTYREVRLFHCSSFPSVFYLFLLSILPLLLTSSKVLSAFYFFSYLVVLLSNLSVTSFAGSLRFLFPSGFFFSFLFCSLSLLPLSRYFLFLSSSSLLPTK
jgi:hypothetical protein